MAAWAGSGIPATLRREALHRPGSTTRRPAKKAAARRASGGAGSQAPEASSTPSAVVAWRDHRAPCGTVRPMRSCVPVFDVHGYLVSLDGTRTVALSDPVKVSP